MALKRAKATGRPSANRLKVPASNERTEILKLADISNMPELDTSGMPELDTSAAPDIGDFGLPELDASGLVLPGLIQSMPKS